MRLTLGLVLSTTVAALPRLAKDALAPQVKLPDPDRHALRLMEFYNAPENQAADQIKRRSEASARDAEAECVVAGAQCCSNPSGEPFCLGGFSCDNDACVAVVADAADAVAALERFKAAEAKALADAETAQKKREAEKYAKEQEQENNKKAEVAKQKKNKKSKVEEEGIHNRNSKGVGRGKN